jgi:hypothetical protein
MVQRSKKGSKWEEMNLQFQTNKNEFNINVEPAKGIWLLQLLPLLSIGNGNGLSIEKVKENYANAGLDGFELFWDNKPMTGLYKAGLLCI